jgi:hypothetical protein
VARDGKRMPLVLIEKPRPHVSLITLVDRSA